MGREQPVTIARGTLAASLYRAGRVTEPYYCNYGLNPEYRGRLEEAGLIVSGTGADGEVRIVELATHPFFLATLFVPQARSSPEHPHPVFRGFASAASQRASDA